MGILLVNEGRPVMVALSEGMVAGERVQSRQYLFDGKFLLIDGQTHVVEHDVQEILKMDGYRLATAQEQNEHTKSQSKSTRLTERKG